MGNMLKNGRAKCGQFYQVPHSLHGSPAYRSLSNLGFRLLHVLMEQYRGNNNGNLTLADKILEQQGSVWPRSSKLKASKELVEKGLIAVTQQGKISCGNICIPTLYRLTWLPQNEIPALSLEKRPPTREFAQWKPEPR